jgi:hypothetical protein
MQVHNVDPRLKYWPLGPMQLAVTKTYSKNVITYKRALTDRCYKNLELRSHPLIETYTSRAKSPGLLHRDPPKLMKAYDGL